MVHDDRLVLTIIIGTTTFWEKKTLGLKCKECGRRGLNQRRSPCTKEMGLAASNGPLSCREYGQPELRERGARARAEGVGRLMILQRPCIGSGGEQPLRS